MAQYIPKEPLVAEIERLISNGKLKCQQSQENNDRESYITWSEHIATCGKILSFLNTLEVKDSYEQYVQYPTVRDGIEAHAKTYSFNIESVLFPQLTKEQQALWRKEIEQACISGGEMGVELARDPRYKENLEVKEVNLEKHLKEEIEDVFFDLNGVAVKSATYYITVEDVKEIAKHFFELGLKAQKGE